MIISERIFKIMEEKGMTQLEFSAGTGIAQSTISDWKRKKTNPSAEKQSIWIVFSNSSNCFANQQNKRTNQYCRILSA